MSMTTELPTPASRLKPGEIIWFRGSWGHIATVSSVDDSDDYVVTFSDGTTTRMTPRDRAMVHCAC